MLQGSPIADFLDRLAASEQGPLLGRLEELRTRIVRCMVLVFVLFAVAFGFGKELLLTLEVPLKAALPAGVQVLHFTGPLEVFYAYVQVAFLVAVCLAAPVLFLQIWAFVRPALPAIDRRLVIPFFLASLTLFAGGIGFCWGFMLPLALEFLIGMGQTVAQPTIMVADYVSLTTFLLLGFGVVFQMPVVLVILERTGAIQVETLTKHRRIVIVVMFVVGALLTPPDPISQIAMAVPLYLMFEASILVMKALGRRAGKEAA